ncbi:M1 family metallopeptidase [Kitasatospora sp. NPDC050543]|uniref:M1 family metallopeptidase n=1 Tax=Kitasatospora sp. NPDC050543 TaxID=3364054 RepID=UPI0037B23BC7
MTSRECAALALSVTCATALFTAAPASTAPATAAPVVAPLGGDQGQTRARDPYFPLSGNQGYDVQHYDLGLDFTPASHELAAEATITARAERRLARFTLDYSGPPIQRITVDGREAAYRREGQKLTVVPAEALRPGRDFTVQVRYGGRPEPINDPALGLYGWINTDDGAVTLNEPDGARTWYPVNDDLRDKATYTFRITTPTGVTALANGEPQGRPRAGNGRTTATWTMAKPMASYLAMVAIGNFDVTRTQVDGIPNITAYDPAIPGDDSFLHSATAAAEQWGVTKFGRYPFDSMGGVIDPSDAGYALETQSRPVYDSPPDESAVVHESAHQWFGDSVTPTSWQDIWLNEGFATYAEWLWQEEHGGPSAQETFDGLYATPAGDPFWQLKTGDPGRDEMFNYDVVYLRGAMTLQELRSTIGDDAFFRLLREWNERYRYGNVGTCDLIRLAEEISHRDLQPLFQAWLYTAAKPAR